MSRPIIEVESLSKCYRLGAIGATSLRESFHRWVGRLRGAAPAVDERDFWALRDVSFAVQPGEVIGVIGRNGAGKSTLLKILSRITEPTSGRARLRGRVASLLEVGTGFHPDLTGRENVFLNGAILGMRRAEVQRKLDEIVAFAEIAQFIDTPVKRYSSGMYVRLAFAVAAHLEPEILIVDEVLAVGDAAFQKKCLGKMEDVSASGRTVIFVSHNMPSLQSLCSRVILLDKGRVVHDADPITSITRYLRIDDHAHALKPDLRTHARRRHSRLPVLQSAWVESASGQPVGEVRMGEPVSFCLEYASPETLHGPVFGFGIEDPLGKRIFSINNLMRPLAQPMDQTRAGVARFSLPVNPLLPGTYFLSVAVVESPAAWVDFVEQAVEFTVVGSDVYGSGRIPEPAHGLIFVDGTLAVQPLSA